MNNFSQDPYTRFDFETFQRLKNIEEKCLALENFQILERDLKRLYEEVYRKEDCDPVLKNYMEVYCHF
jgi:hypothetical protein